MELGNSTLLDTVVIEEYPTRIKVADKIRPKYYKRGMKLPKTYTKENGYTFKNGYLYKNGEKVLKNSRTAGKPRYESLAGNKFSYGQWHHHKRAKVVRGLKEIYIEKIGDQISPFDPSDFPLRVEWDLYTTIEDMQDLSNLWFYYKYFEDSLVDIGILPDDSLEYVTHPPSPRFFPVEDHEDRKFVFRFFRDVRSEIRLHNLWR